MQLQGGLSAELSRHPVLTCMDSGGPRTIVMGFERLVSWSEEDSNQWIEVKLGTQFFLIPDPNRAWFFPEELEDY